MNCHPTLCGMLVDVDGSGRVTVRGDPDNPDSRGFLCVRGQASREIIGNPLRLLQPRIREGRGTDRWREADWDEALGLIADRMGEVGPAAVGLWVGHGAMANNYGTRVSAQLVRRFANLHGSQTWSPTSICWGLGGFGLGLTGVLEANTKEDLGDNAGMVMMWGATIASQPNTARHLVRARKRGAFVVTIDVRETEATARSDEMILIRPGTDAALALGLMHVIVRDGLHDREFVAAHTVGFEELRAHLVGHSPEWAEAACGVPAATIEALARRYATTRPAMIVLGGSSMHKGAAGWEGGPGDRLPAGADGQRRHTRRRVRPASRRAQPRPGADRHRSSRATAARRLGAEPDGADHGGAARPPGARDAPVRHQHGLVVRGRPAGHGGAPPDRPRGRPRPLHVGDGAHVRRRRAPGDVVARGDGLQEHEHPPVPDAAGARPAGRDAVRRPRAARPRRPSRPRRLLALGGRCRGPERDPRPPLDRSRHDGGARGRRRYPGARDLPRGSPGARVPDAVRQDRVPLRTRRRARVAGAAGAHPAGADHRCR